MDCRRKRQYSPPVSLAAPRLARGSAARRGSRGRPCRSPARRRSTDMRPPTETARFRCFSTAEPTACRKPHRPPCMGAARQSRDGGVEKLCTFRMQAKNSEWTILQSPPCGGSGSLYTREPFFTCFLDSLSKAKPCKYFITIHYYLLLPKPQRQV